MTHHPRVVTICGSTRYRGEIAAANRRLTLDGAIVLAPGVFAHDGDQTTSAEKAALDHLHLRKIDLADEVVVVNPAGYIGESTCNEIAYARRAGKPVRYTVPCCPDHDRLATPCGPICGCCMACPTVLVGEDR
jgi:hypothetical protein